MDGGGSVTPSLAGIHHMRFLSFGEIKKPLLPQREQGQEYKFLRYHLACRSPGHFTRCQHIVRPLTLAVRQKILSFRCSPCPRRSICCSAFRPTLSTGDSLWMRKQRYLRFNGLDIEDIKLHFCLFVKYFFSPLTDTPVAPVLPHIPRHGCRDGKAAPTNCRFDYFAQISYTSGASTDQSSPSNS